MSYPSLKNHFLIAMPQLDDPNFHQSITWVVEHNADGAMGVTVNRPSSLTLNDILTDLDIDYDGLPANHQVVLGGPVRPAAGFIFHPDNGEEWSSSQLVIDWLRLNTSEDILDAIAAGRVLTRSSTDLGYA